MQYLLQKVANHKSNVSSCEPLVAPQWCGMDLGSGFAGMSDMGAAPLKSALMMIWREKKMQGTVWCCIKEFCTKNDEISQKYVLCYCISCSCNMVSQCPNLDTTFWTSACAAWISTLEEKTRTDFVKNLEQKPTHFKGDTNTSHWIGVFPVVWHMQNIKNCVVPLWLIFNSCTDHHRPWQLLGFTTELSIIYSKQYSWQTSVVAWFVTSIVIY